MTNERLLTKEEVAVMLRMSVRTVDRRLKEGKLKQFRPGLFRREDIEQYLQSDLDEQPSEG